MATPHLPNLLLAGTGAAIGGILRYLIGFAWLGAPAGAAFPWGTFLVNLTGCLAVGLFAAFVAPTGLSTDRRMVFLIVGVLGGYTTFSGFALEVFRMIENGKAAQAMIYLGATNTLCVFLAFAGLKLGRALQ